VNATQENLYLEEVLRGLLPLEGDEPEPFSNFRRFVDGNLELGDFAELAEELFYHLVRQFRLQTADEDFT
jgi:hypothetical protein